MSERPAGMPSAPPPETVSEARDWQRLSPRMLLVHPVRQIGQLLLPIVIAAFGFGKAEDQGWWVVPLIASVLVIPFGLITWATTRYRFTDSQLQVRRGLVSKKLLTAPLDRVRSVDIESSPLLRIMGLSKVKVGTGVDSSMIELDGLRSEQAAELRGWLLRRAGQVAGAGVLPAEGASLSPGAPGLAGAPGSADTPIGAPGPTTAPGDGTAPAGPSAYPDLADTDGLRPGERELARIDWSWLRFAPFSLSSLAIVAGAVALLAQFGENLPIDEQTQAVQEAGSWLLEQALAVLVAGIALVLLVGWVLVSTLNYVLAWWNLRVVREPSGSLRITKGLLTTTSQTVEREKVRGVTMGEPFLLRLVRGAELTALATGVGSGGTTKVLPPAPRRVVEQVGHTLLEEDGPLTMPLVGHGPMARRRAHTRGLQTTLVLVLLACVPRLLPEGWWMVDRWGWWVPLTVLAVRLPLQLLLAESAWRNLGHGLTGRHLVSQSGAIIRTREVLERDGIIGWSVEQSFWQRRLGLSTLIATTAVGAEQVVVSDVPYPVGVELARGATRGMLEPFLR